MVLVVVPWLAACGGDEGAGTDTTPDVEADGSGGDADGSGDVAEDTSVDDTAVDTGVAELQQCVPGTRICPAPDATTVLVCSGRATWETEACEPGDICFAGECGTPGTCEPGSVDACVGCSTYQGCNAAGTKVGEFAVPPNLTCVERDGVPQLISRVCTPNETRCADERVQTRCDECGLGFVEAVDCFEQDETTLCDDGRCQPLCEYIRKRKTYIGCEYWGIDLDNAFVRAGGSIPYYDAFGAQYSVVVSNPSAVVASTVTVTRFDEGRGEVVTLAEVRVEPGALEIINLPASSLNGTMIGYEAYRIQATVPIVAYQFNPLENEEVFSNDASLLFPTSSLGNEYYVMTRRQTFDELKGYVTVAPGLADGPTEVTLTLPPYTDENPVITLSGRNIPAMRGGDTYTVTLDPYEVLNIETNRRGADLTGTFVRSNRPLVVFGGSEAANAPNDDSCIRRGTEWVCAADRTTPCVNEAGEPDIALCSSFITCCADHIEHQMPPIDTWGKRFKAARSMPRGDEADVWRILAEEDGTVVDFIGLPDSWPLPGLLPPRLQRQVTLDAGQWFELQSPVDFEINSTKPILVGQFLAAEQAPYPPPIDADMPDHENAGTGDPAFIVAIPVEQYRSDYIFLAPNAYAFDYVTITAPVGARVLLDGVEVPAEAWNTFGTGTHHAARLEIADGVHRIVSEPIDGVPQPVGVVVYGYDQYVSYGYAAGMDQESIVRR
jgi:hypothetical protein